jgi:ribulose-bisphosphate carboxylase small chain
MKTLPKERRYETMSYLPPLSDDQIRRQIQYVLENGFIPAIEFNESSEPTDCYWTLWKLPLFKATSPDDVLQEVRECRQANPDCFIRMVGFDNVKQCQILSFIINKPNSNSRSW